MDCPFWSGFLGYGQRRLLVFEYFLGILRFNIKVKVLIQENQTSVGLIMLTALFCQPELGYNCTLMQVSHLALAYNFQMLTIGNKVRAGIFKHSMGARNRVGIGLSYRPARLHRLAELIPWNRILGSINV